MEEQENAFCMEWLNELLNSLEKNVSEEKCMTLFKPCGKCHVKYLKPLISNYIGDLQGFIRYMEKECGQQITYDENKQEIIVDENKNYCVCPIAKRMKEGRTSPILCNCSANMTAEMISEITGQKVKAQVMESILRGNSSCKYKIELLGK
jgi:predicted hydrocarbon binding protein